MREGGISKSLVRRGVVKNISIGEKKLAEGKKLTATLMDQ